MKKMLSLSLVVLMLLAVLCGCSNNEERIAEIAGTWESIDYFTGSSVEQLLYDMDLYEEEVALLDTSTMRIVDVIVFNTDGTYTITSDVDKTLAAVEQYYRDAFNTFYTNRAQLESCYDEDLESMTIEEFQQFYADLYGREDFDALIAMFVNSTTDEEHLTSDEENGTFRMTSSRIYFSINGTQEEEYVTYSLSGNVLALNFSDGINTYNRAQDD